MNHRYDVGIIGGGRRLFTPPMNVQLCRTPVIMLEAGDAISTATAPSRIKGKQLHQVQTCGIMRGFGGAETFSDGKFNLTTGFGGWLNDISPMKRSWIDLSC